MPMKAIIPKCTEEDRAVLQQWANSSTLEARLVERAGIILRWFAWRVCKQYCTQHGNTSQYGN